MRTKLPNAPQKPTPPANPMGRPRVKSHRSVGRHLRKLMPKVLDRLNEILDLPLGDGSEGSIRVVELVRACSAIIAEAARPSDEKANEPEIPKPGSGTLTVELVEGGLHPVDSTAPKKAKG